MTEEVNNQPEQKNTVATVGMWFSISGLVAIIFIVLGIWCLIGEYVIGIFLLFTGIILGLLSFGYLNFLVGFVLGIIGLFYKPRKKARIAVCIPLVIFVIIELLGFYVKKSIETPFNEFVDWVKPQLEQFKNDENFDKYRFGGILESELNSITDGKSKNEWKELFESSTGSNSLEKGAYMLSSMFKESFENALEKYNNGELPEISDENNQVVTVDVDINDEDENNDEDNNEKGESEEVSVEQPKSSNGTFSQSEKNDIEQILNILE